MVLYTPAVCVSGQEVSTLTETEEAAEQEYIKEPDPQAEEGTVELFAKNARDIPELLEVISDEYKKPAKQEGSLVRLDYETWESFSYEQHSQKLIKTAWVYLYLPYGYDENQAYNIFYLSHGPWAA